MRSAVAVLLLLLQFGPLAGAGICMRAASQPKTECSMPMPGMTHESGRPNSTPTQDCAQMVVCAPAAPVVPAVALQSWGLTPAARTTFSNPSSLLAGDPIAPPQPPPIV